MNFAQLTRSFGVKSSTSHAGAMGCTTLCGAVVGCISLRFIPQKYEKLWVLVAKRAVSGLWQVYVARRTKLLLPGRDAPLETIPSVRRRKLCHLGIWHSPVHVRTRMALASKSDASFKDKILKRLVQHRPTETNFVFGLFMLAFQYFLNISFLFVVLVLQLKML